MGLFTVSLKPDTWMKWEWPAAGSDSGSDSGSWSDNKPIQWELLISWMLWLNSGYLGLGSLAAGVDNPKRTFPLIVLTLIPFVLCVILLPFFGKSHSQFTMHPC